jgi:hypothetical protein
VTNKESFSPLVRQGLLAILRTEDVTRSNNLSRKGAYTMGSDGTENCVPEVPFAQLMLDQTHKHLRKLRWIGKHLEAQAILEASDDPRLRPPILDDRRKQGHFD